MTRLVAWWACLAISVAMAVAALTSNSGTYVDSADAAASSCRTTGEGGLLLMGLASLGLSL